MKNFKGFHTIVIVTGALMLGCLVTVGFKEAAPAKLSPVCYLGNTPTDTDYSVHTPQVGLPCTGVAYKLVWCQGGWNYDSGTGYWDTHHCHASGTTTDQYHLIEVTSTGTPPDGWYNGGEPAGR